MADINETNVNESTGVQNVEAQAQVNTQQEAPKPMSFDEFLKQPGMQAEFDRRVGKGIKTAEAKFKDPEVEQLRTQLTGYIRRESAARAGVPEQFREFVMYQVSKDDPSDFDAALATYLENNPQFKQAVQSAEPAKPASWGQPQQGMERETQMSGVEAAFRKRNPNLKY